MGWLQGHALAQQKACCHAGHPPQWTIQLTLTPELRSKALQLADVTLSLGQKILK